MSDWVQTGLPCLDTDGCGSSDAMSINSDGWHTCFSCQQRFPPKGETMTPTKSTKVKGDISAYFDGNAKAIPDRCLTVATVRKYGVSVRGEVHIYPYYATDSDRHGEVLAAQWRRPGKNFPSEGPMNECGLFGQQLFPAGGRSILISEGATDAMAGYQLQDSKYPSVAVRNASSALADCKRNYKYIDSFRDVFICMDNDKAGAAAAEQIAELFSGKAYVLTLPEEFNDLVDMNVVGKRGQQAFKTALHTAKKYMPEDMIAGVDMWELVSKPVEAALLKYPWKGLNDLTYGIRPSEMVTVVAGTGLGKTAFLREVIGHLLTSSDDNIGCAFLEDSVRTVGLGLMGIHANRPIHLPNVDLPPAELREAYENTLGADRLFFWGHHGSTTIDEALSKIRWQVKAMDCKVIVLDHVSMMVSAQEQLDERKALDEIVTKLRMLVQELDIAMFLVSHLKRPDGKGHEDGGATALSQLRGTAAIAQLSDIVIGLERNGQHDDLRERNTTRVRVLKNRFSGETGKATTLLFDKGTGRMSEIDDDFDVRQIEEAL